MLIRSFAAIAVKLAFAAFAIFAFSAAAEAQYLTFVSATGLDSRPCTVEAQPCQTLPRAVAATAPGGTIRVVSDLPGQPTTVIGKSLTVEGGGKSMIGTIVINPDASAVVILRGLHLTGRGAFANGIVIASAAAVHVEDCTVERYTGDGITVFTTTATKQLFVSNTVSRDNGRDGLRVSATSAHLTVENSRFENNSFYGVEVLAGVKASIIRSVASGNYNGMSFGGETDITETTAVHNTSNGFVFAAGATVSETTAADNGGSGFEFDTNFRQSTPNNFTLASSVAKNNNTGVSVSSVSAVTITDCVIVKNSVAINNGGAVHTRQNNTVSGATNGNAPIPLGAY